MDRCVYGIYSTHKAKPYIYSYTIKHSRDGGIRLYDSSPRISYTKIDSNSNAGLVCEVASTKFIIAYPTTAMYGQYNYWGEIPPKPSRFVAPVDTTPPLLNTIIEYEPYLTSPPSFPKPAMPMIYASEDSTRKEADEFADIENNELMQNPEKKSKLKLFVEKYPNSVEALSAMTEIAYLSTEKYNRDDFISFADNVINRHQSLAYQASILKMRFLHLKGEYHGAVSLGKNILSHYPNHPCRSEIYHILFKVLLRNLNDLSGAEKYLSKLASEFPDLALTNIAIDDFKHFAGKDFMKPLKEKDDEKVAKQTSLPEKYHLGQNYPNPFNPSTIIRFQIPKLEDVKIVVYNILGQEIKTIINIKMPAGSYEVQWDGRNNSGLLVPSGVYFYMLKTPNYRMTKKMLMLK